MPAQLIKPVSMYHYSELYRDFLGCRPELKKYLYAESPADVADMIGSARVGRNELCDILIRQNRQFNAKPGTLASIEKLRNDNALCVFTGQQVGLLGGPLLTLYKAIGTVKMAAKLQMEFDRPVVPVFWMAADDHDYDEVSHFHYIEDDGSPGKFVYSSRSLAGVPVSEVFLDNKDDYDRFADSVRRAYGATDFTEELYERLFAAYRMDANLTNAFGRYFADIFPDLGLILFSPADIEVKKLSRRFFQRVAEHYFNVKSLLEETATSLAMDRYHVQSEKKLTAVHLFYHDPVRRPIHFADETYLVGDKRLALPGLHDLIERNPELFSPDVLTRPVWQSYLFPVVAHAGGPGEIAYFCQIGKLFRLFELTQPYYFARPSATIVEKRHEEFMRKHQLELSDLTGDIEQLVNRILGKSFPEDMEEKFNAFRGKLESDYNDLVRYILTFEENLEPMARQVLGKIDYALKILEKKTFDRHKKQMQATRNQIYRLASALYPYHNLQERSYNINYFISKHGFEIVDHIFEMLDRETTDHQIIYLSEYRQ
ncbi:MAG: bacillithiol biosynthesis cysteine-adding enzyme BshC [Candidatus Zixiibacteriota bacterium]|nr:MAG: bacillithiol biosynthesis cysteine-adding enzyme BshC [candidate division Zixibacteria bacterium]